jgi:hypothetical protein
VTRYFLLQIGNTPALLNSWTSRYGSNRLTSQRRRAFPAKSSSGASRNPGFLALDHVLDVVGRRRDERLVVAARGDPLRIAVVRQDAIELGPPLHLPQVVRVDLQVGVLDHEGLGVIPSPR